MYSDGVPTKEGYTDSGNCDWTGSLVVHELSQNEDGTLAAKIPESILTHAAGDQALSGILQSDGVIGEDAHFTITSQGEADRIDQVQRK